MKGNSLSIDLLVISDTQSRPLPDGKHYVYFKGAWDSDQKCCQFFCESYCSEIEADYILENVREDMKISVIDGHIINKNWCDKSGTWVWRTYIDIDDPINNLVIEELE